MADRKQVRGTAVALTITLASLATSSTRVAGREGTAINTTTDNFLDYILSGKITTGTSPTDNQIIEIWAYGSLDDTPSYPDQIAGLDGARTLTSEQIKYSGLHLVATINTNNTSNRTYPIAPVSLAHFFKGSLPKYIGIFVTHSTGVNLHATAGNHAIVLTPVYETLT